MALSFAEVEEFALRVSGNIIRLGLTLQWSQGDGRSGFLFSQGTPDDPNAGTYDVPWRLNPTTRVLSTTQRASFNDRGRTVDMQGTKFWQYFDCQEGSLDPMEIAMRRAAGETVRVSLTATRWTQTPDVIEMTPLPGTRIYTGLGKPIGQSPDRALYCLSMHSMEWVPN